MPNNAEYLLQPAMISLYCTVACTHLHLPYAVLPQAELSALMEGSAVAMTAEEEEQVRPR